MQAQKRTSPFYADFLSPYNTPAEDQRHSQGCPTEMLRRKPGNAGVFDLYPTENAFGGGPGYIPHKISCGNWCGGPGFYPAENAFGGDPDYIPHKISCGNYCGDPGFYPTKNPADFTRGPRDIPFLKIIDSGTGPGLLPHKTCVSDSLHARRKRKAAALTRKRGGGLRNFRYISHAFV